jgi:hypothetical protein
VDSFGKIAHSQSDAARDGRGSGDDGRDHGDDVLAVSASAAI